MKKTLIGLIGIALLAICLNACGWKPEVTAVPLTAPWTTMNLPVKDNAIVWSSTDKELKVVHKDDKKTVAGKYIEAFKAQGWQLGKFDTPTDRYTAEMTKGAEKLSLEFYDFSNTGVIIEKTGGATADAGKTTAPPTTSGDTNTAPTKSGDSTAEKADFTVTAEQLDKEFTVKGAKEADLQKYANKNIAVSGRVSTLVTEKQGQVQPWVTLYAPGTLHGVSCYFDDENVDQMKKLTMDKNAKVQGFQNDFIVPEVSPRLDHCVVLEGS